MPTLSNPPSKIRTRAPLYKLRPLSHEVPGVVLGKRTSGDVQNGGIRGTSVRPVNRVDRVAVPCYVVAWTHGRDVNHRLGEVEMGVEEGGEFLAVARGGALEPGGGRGVHFPVLGGEEIVGRGQGLGCGLRTGRHTRDGGEERTEEVVSRCLREEGIHQ